MSEEKDAGERYYHYMQGDVVDFCLKCNAYPTLFKQDDGKFFLSCEPCEKAGLPHESLLMAVLEWNKVERNS